MADNDIRKVIKGSMVNNKTNAFRNQSLIYPRFSKEWKVRLFRAAKQQVNIQWAAGSVAFVVWGVLMTYGTLFAGMC